MQSAPDVYSAFHEMLKLLECGKPVTVEVIKAAARRFWDAEALVDYHPQDLGEDEALVALGLARTGWLADYEEEGTLYEGIDYEESA